MPDRELTDELMAQWEASGGYTPLWGGVALIREVRKLREEAVALRGTLAERTQEAHILRGERVSEAQRIAELREALAELVQAMERYEMDVDEPAPHPHRQMMDHARELLK